MNSYDDLFSSQKPENQKEKEFVPFNKDEWSAQKQKERADAFALIDETATKIAKDGNAFQTYLNVLSRFDRYSTGNTLLIAAQRPEATRLADFNDWKANGVSIRKGETGIVLLEPGEEYTREDGTVHVSYNSKKVFDVLQTTAKETQPVVTRDSRLLLKALINHSPCKIAISEDLPENVGAVYQPDKKVILVRQGMDAPDIFRSLSQELAHAHMDKGDYNRSDCAFDAYCISYVICKRSNVAVDTFRFDRLPDNFASIDAKTMRAELSGIRNVANDISADMSRILDTQQRSQKSRDDGAR